MTKRIQRHVEAEPDQVKSELIRAGKQMGYIIDAASTTPDILVLRKSASAFSWGSPLHVSVRPGYPIGSDVWVHTSDTARVTTWGRGKRAPDRLLSHLRFD